MPSISIGLYAEALAMEAELKVIGIHSWVTTGGLAVQDELTAEQEAEVRRIAAEHEGDYTPLNETAKQVLFKTKDAMESEAAHITRMDALSKKSKALSKKSKAKHTKRAR